jgi:hypothetical protein
VLFAGDKALARVRDEGLSPRSITTIVGAAGGPKWLVLVGLDRAIFFQWLREAGGPIELVGSSIGAWRFSALAQGRWARDAHEKLRRAYTDQHYDTKPTPQDVTDEAARIRDVFLTHEGIDAILDNPVFRLTIISARGKGAFASGKRSRLALGMLAAGMANVLSRKHIGRFFVRTVFSDTRDGRASRVSGSFRRDGLPTEEVALTRGNIRQAILASGSIPLVMEGVRDIPGAPLGIYWDGGLVDYHVTIPRSPDREGIVLFPHYVDRISPGWFDKFLSRRGKGPTDQDWMLVIAPSPEFVARLPHGRIPDRTDFQRFRDNDKERLKFWDRTAKESERLGDEFLELVGSGKLGGRVKPLSSLGI